MSFPNGWLTRTPDLCVRPVPEMGFCLVYNPHARDIYTLNPAVWLAFELCHERTRAAARDDYVGTFEPGTRRERAAEEFAAALDRLRRLGLVIEHEAAPVPADGDA